MARKNKISTVPKKIVKKSASVIKKTTKHPLDVLKKVSKKINNTKIVRAANKTKVGKFIKKAGDKTGDVAKFIVLAPYRFLMTKMLKKKGVSVPNKATTATIANLFYMNVILKQTNLEYIEHADQVKTEASVYNAAKLASSAAGVPPVAVDIVKVIIDFFKGMEKKKKKEDGIPTAELTEDEKKFIDEKEPLTKEEKELTEDVTKTSDELAKVIPDTKDSTGKIHTTSYRPILNVLGLIH